MDAELLRTFEAKFWTHVEKTDTCWLWRGNRSPDGAMRYYLRNQGRMSPQAYAWFLKTGDHCRSAELLRTCMEPLCIRPDHHRYSPPKEPSQKRQRARTQRLARVISRLDDRLAALAVEVTTVRDSQVRNGPRAVAALVRALRQQRDALRALDASVARVSEQVVRLRRDMTGLSAAAADTEAIAKAVAPLGSKIDVVIAAVRAGRPVVVAPAPPPAPDALTAADEQDIREVLCCAFADSVGTAVSPHSAGAEQLEAVFDQACVAGGGDPRRTKELFLSWLGRFAQHVAAGAAGADRSPASFLRAVLAQVGDPRIAPRSA